ncbi:MAG: GNAT family N-acetyltransferase [Lysobacter sp.]|nr:GNAT family N-acetyltransferase [Lysobacter sp.]
MDIRPATTDEHPAIRGLLGSAALPVADLADVDVAFLVAHDGARLVGAIGLQPFDGVGLLRSLVVDADARGSGIGDRLVRALEEDAGDRGLRQLVLLTQTAAPFFTRRGYGVIERAAAPATVQASAEFRALCPDSATCMAKHLEMAE